MSSMGQHDSAIACSTPMGQDGMTFHTALMAQAPFDQWAGVYQPYTIQDQMEWLSGNSAQYGYASQGHATTLQHSMSDPGLNATRPQNVAQNNQPQPGLERTPSYPSEIYSSSTVQASAAQASGGLDAVDRGSVDRPLSAGTMLDSASSNTSRPSSENSSPVSRMSKFKVPAIRTQFDDHSRAATLHGTPLSDGFQVAPDPDSMTAMSNEWMSMHDNADHSSIHEQSLGTINLKTSPALLEPFQWQSPVTRRTSVSSITTAGQVFSPYGTPGSAVWQQPILNSPYPQQQQQPSQQQSQQQQHYQWTPVSNQNLFTSSPQSPHQRNYGTWSRAQYLNALRQHRQMRPTSNTMPNRGKPRLIRNITDTYAAIQGTPAQAKPRSFESRARARAESASLPASACTQQLPLPAFQLGTFFASPDVSQAEFQGVPEAMTPNRHVLPSSATQTPIHSYQSTPRTTMTPNFNALHMTTPFVCSQPFPQVPTNVPSTPAGVNPIPTPAHQPPLPVPSEPPLSDFMGHSAPTADSDGPKGHACAPACGPIRQSPHFEGDIYTPRYKRRNAAGKWEGWCGYCQPGRWLDLKNSRYWEDKLRNHGICARTKTFFEGPLRVRWVSDRGTIWEGEPGDNGYDLAGKEGIEDDGVGRKREGLCGECHTWVGMDGQRSRGKGRCVNWWMHAYKCHEQSKSRTDGTGIM